MKHLHKVASDIPKLRKMDFKYHCCVEAKMKHAPKLPRSITVIIVPGQVVSMDIVGPFQVKSIQKEQLWASIHRALHQYAISLRSQE